MTNEAGRLSGYSFRPEEIEGILEQARFHTFHDKSERSAHDSLHNGINGAFRIADLCEWFVHDKREISVCVKEELTSNTDPLFYVYHVQMDRLWWLWQMKDPEKRMDDYKGREFYYDEWDNAELNDLLTYEGLVEDVRVREIMHTRTRRLCYRY